MDILYEDNHIIVAVKPQNMPSQADSSGDADFLSRIREYVRVKYNKPGEAYIGLVHRLDRPAGGVMVFARTSKAASRLSEQLRGGQFQKTYRAVTAGVLPPSGTLENWMKKNGETNVSNVVSEREPGAKYAALSYRVVCRREGYSLLEIDLVTGRSHQIRVQLAAAGAPLVGDVKYGGARGGRLCLWSCAVRFAHPTKKEEMAFSCPPPDLSPWNLFG